MSTSFANNGTSGAPDATVRITNPGTSIGIDDDTAPVTNGNLCAMIYVFDNDQQMTECCGCLTTPDGLRTLSVTKDLTSNPLTGVVSKNGDIKSVCLFGQCLAVRSHVDNSWRRVQSAGVGDPHSEQGRICLPDHRDGI